MSTTETGAVYFDPYTPEITINPYPVYRRLREEAPLYYNEQHDFYALSRFEDVERGLMDHQTYSSARGAILEIIKAEAEFPPGVLIFEDPPVHTMYRNLLGRLFTPKRLNALDQKIHDICAECLDPLVGAEGFDFIANLGAQMPMRVIGMLLGIPEQDLQAVRKQADSFLRTEAGKPMEFVESNYTGESFEEYIDWRIKHPSDDVMTELLNAEFKDQEGVTRKLTREEVLTLVNVLAAAGNETTNRLIGWSGKLLAEHPDQRRLLVQDPSLIPSAIEEILRLEPPGPHIARYVTRDVEYYGKKVPKGSVMMFMVGAANRDDRRFTNGDSLDVRRELKPHLTFGYGIHACVGRVLARLEGRIALEEVLKRFHDWEVDYSKAVLSPTSTVRGWETLPVFTRPSPGSSTSQQAQSKADTGAVPLEGKWTVTVKGPTGPMPSTLVLERKDGVLTGSMSGQGTTTAISDAKLEGDKISWINHVTKPMKLKAEFSGVISGKEMSGKVKTGFMGSFPFTGVKE
jgi:cytochrome P450